MAGIQKQLATFPSVYSKDYKFYKDFHRSERSGTYEPFTLGPKDAALFRIPVTEEIFPDVVDVELISVPESDPNYMKSIYRSDYKGEKPKPQATEECTGNLVEVAEKRLARPSRRPLLPLTSGLRVLPGLPRFYHIPQSEFDDTISRVGLMKLKRGQTASKETGPAMHEGNTQNK